MVIVNEDKGFIDQPNQVRKGSSASQGGLQVCLHHLWRWLGGGEDDHHSQFGPNSSVLANVRTCNIVSTCYVIMTCNVVCTTCRGKNGKMQLNHTYYSMEFDTTDIAQCNWWKLWNQSTPVTHVGAHTTQSSSQTEMNVSTNSGWTWLLILTPLCVQVEGCTNLPELKTHDVEDLD